MTYPYEWNPLPHKLDIRCPSCGGHAQFEFAEIVSIQKSDILFFESSKLFEYQQLPRTFRGRNNPHAAIYYHGLHRSSLHSIDNLPNNYQASDWEHSRFWMRPTDFGTSTCKACFKRKKTTLDWPAQAWYQTNVRGQVLWAFNRGSLIALRDYIAAKERDKARNVSYRCFLMNIPSHFLSAKVRGEAVKKLNRLLTT